MLLVTSLIDYQIFLYVEDMILIVSKISQHNCKYHDRFKMLLDS